ncbi:MAG: hypothetical protein AAF423_14280 [Pseudomonadota bacterium]
MVAVLVANHLIDMEPDEARAAIAQYARQFPNRRNLVVLLNFVHQNPEDFALQRNIRRQGCLIYWSQHPIGGLWSGRTNNSIFTEELELRRSSIDVPASPDPTIACVLELLDEDPYAGMVFLRQFAEHCGVASKAVFAGLQTLEEHKALVAQFEFRLDIETGRYQLHATNRG